jgi:hypothetical protein
VPKDTCPALDVVQWGLMHDKVDLDICLLKKMRKMIGDLVRGRCGTFFPDFEAHFCLVLDLRPKLSKGLVKL